MVEIIVMLLIQWTPTSCVNYCCCHLVAKVHVLSRKKTFLSSQEQGGVLEVRDYLPLPAPGCRKVGSLQTLDTHP